MYKQVIIARKDLNMSPGKLAAQVSHGSIAFMLHDIRKHSSLNTYEHRHLSYDPDRGGPLMYKRGDLYQWAKEAFMRGEQYFYTRPVEPDNPYGELELCQPTYCYNINYTLPQAIFEQWINEAQTKVVCEAKNLNAMNKAIKIAEELGLKEGEDFFKIYDACRTELEPETDHGTLTVIGFCPLDAEIADQISKKFQLYHG